MSEISVHQQPVQVGEEPITGADLKKAAGIDLNRQLLLVRPEGPKLVRNDEHVQVQPDDRFENVPNWQYGGRDGKPRRKKHTHANKRNKTVGGSHTPSESDVELANRQIEALLADDEEPQESASNTAETTRPGQSIPTDLP